MHATAARWLGGCLVGFLLLLAVGLLVRPLIFTLAPPRDDSVVTLATQASARAGPVDVAVVLSRSRGLDGELDVGNGRVQVSLIVAPTAAGGFSAVNAASPVQRDCPVEIDGQLLRDCAGRAWTLAGMPVDPADPPLQRFAVRLESGGLVADLTRVIDGDR